MNSFNTIFMLIFKARVRILMKLLYISLFDWKKPLFHVLSGPYLRTTLNKKQCTIQKARKERLIYDVLKEFKGVEN